MHNFSMLSCTRPRMNSSYHRENNSNYRRSHGSGWMVMNIPECLYRRCWSNCMPFECTFPQTDGCLWPMTEFVWKTIPVYRDDWFDAHPWSDRKTWSNRNSLWFETCMGCSWSEISSYLCRNGFSRSLIGVDCGGQTTDDVMLTYESCVSSGDFNWKWNTKVSVSLWM